MAQRVISMLVLFFLILGIRVASAAVLNDVGESRYTQGGPTKDIFWGLTDANKTKTCILLSGLFEIAIPYDTDYLETEIAMVHVPRNASVNGFCESPSNPDVEMLILTWNPDPNDPELKHNLTFTFERKNNTDNQQESFFDLSAIEAHIVTNDIEFPDAFETRKVYDLTASNLKIMTAPQGHSYFCKSTQVVTFDDAVNSFGMTLTHAEAFNDKIALGTGDDFGPRSFCVRDGFEVIMMVMTYILILSLIGIAVFYIVDRRSKRDYVYL